MTKPIIVDGKEIGSVELASLKQHVEMLQTTAIHAGDRYYTEMMGQLIGVLDHLLNERAN